MEDLFEEGYLEIEEGLVDFLSTFPTENGDRGEDFAHWSIGRKTTALSTGMNENAFLFAQPGFEIGGSGAFFSKAIYQEIGRSTT